MVSGGATGNGQRRGKLLKGLVGAWGFEPQTPTVSSALGLGKSFEINKHYFCSGKFLLHLLHPLLQLLV